MHALVAELAVAQAGYGVVLVKPLLRLGGRLDMPFNQRIPERLRDLVRQHGLAGAGLALDEQRPLQRDGGIDRDFEVAGRDITLGALEAGGHTRSFRGLQDDDRVGTARPQGRG